MSTVLPDLSNPDPLMDATDDVYAHLLAVMGETYAATYRASLTHLRETGRPPSHDDEWETHVETALANVTNEAVARLAGGWVPERSRS